MILPIHLYGSPALRHRCAPLENDSDELQQLIDDMLETMRGADGIGLAAPQVGRTERVFVVDLSPLAEELEEVDPAQPPQPMIFLNPVVRDAFGPAEDYEEGCLSIPDVRELVRRPSAVWIEYLDRDFEPRTGTYDGMLARVIQHEYDHLEGVLFTDLISPFRRRLLKRRLRDMTQGNIEAEYPVVVESARSGAV